MDLPVKSICRPSTFEEAVAAFTEEPSLLPIAGGTDLSVQMRAGKYGRRRLLNLSGIMPTAIKSTRDHLEIGAGATMDDLAGSNEVRSICPALCQAAKQVGAWPIQCRATLGGNLANASPAADTAPPLLVADAIVVAVSLKGRREIEINTFFSGPGSNVLDSGELIHSILLPVRKQSSFSRFTKLGWQREQIISVVNLAVSLDFDDQKAVTRAAIAFGSVAPTPKRAPKVEAALVGKVLNSSARQEAIDAVGEDIAPIDDVRAPAWYRRVAAATLLDRMLEEAASD